MRPIYKYALQYTGISLAVAVAELPAELAFLGVVANPTIEDLGNMMGVLAPAIMAAWLATTIVNLTLARPAWKFLKSREKDQIPDAQTLKAVQRHLTNFPIQAGIVIVIAMVSFISFAGVIMKHFMELSWHDFWIGVLGGSMGAMINFPIAFLATGMVFAPVLREVSELLPPEDRGVRVGWRFGIGAKLFVSVATLVLAVGIFISLVGYTIIYRLVGADNTEAGLSLSVLAFLDPVLPNVSALGRLVLVFVVITLIILGMAIFVAVLIAREIRATITEVTDTAGSIASGKEGAVVAIATNDELGTFVAGFNNMSLELADRTHKLNALMKQVSESIEQVFAASDSLAGIVAEQTAGATEQAASVRELSATSDQIVETARRIANITTQTDEVMDRVVATSDDGRNELANALEGIGNVRNRVDQIANSLIQVGDDSQRAGDIIDIIDDLSERSNLLALNAAIEARAAGESGTRFQVIATEVRRLAENSREATAKIKSIIESIQSSTASSIMHTEEGMKAAHTGEEVVNQVGKRLELILSSIEETAARSRNIFEGTQDQKTSLEQVSGTIAHLSTASEQIAKGYMETESLIRDLSQMAESLGLMVDKG